MNIKNSFPRKIRLNDTHVIREVFDQGAFKSLGSVYAKFKKTEHDSSLFAISVKKKVGNSPLRNRIKRLLREAIRLERSNLKCSFEICFIVTVRPEKELRFQYILDKVKCFFKFLNDEICNEYVKKKEK